MAERTCAVDGCPNDGRLKRGWCPTHYARWMRTGDPGSAQIFEFGKPRLPKTCTVEGCGRRHKAHGLCAGHYGRRQKYGEPGSTPISEPQPGGDCSVEGCGQPIHVKVRRLCKSHYHLWRTTGTTKARPRRTMNDSERKAAERAYQQRYREKRRAAGKVCAVEGCPSLASARGLCAAHYRRWQRYGDPEYGGPVHRNGDVRRCRVDGCEDVVQAKDCCCRHYSRLRRYGDPSPGGPLLKRTKRLPHSASMEERFWVKVEKTDTCWLWLGALNDDGYGLFRTDNRKPHRFAHRVSWELAGNRLEPGKEIDHRCRVRRCVKPEHLRQVTHLVNVSSTRRGQCKRGHPFDAANTVISRDHKGRTRRSCRACYNAWRQRRRALRKVSRADANLAADYRRLIENDPCRYCGGLSEHTEHFYPTAKGGRDFWWNLTRACGPCNRAKGAHCGTWFLLRPDLRADRVNTKAEQGVRSCSSPRTRSTSLPLTGAGTGTPSRR